MKIIKYKDLSTKNKFMIIGAITTWGLIFIGSGTTMLIIDKPITEDIVKTINITQKRVSTNSSNEIILKEIEIKTGEQLSINVMDYLVDGNLLDSELINDLELNISDVNPNQAGIYTYTIIKDKTIYNGQVTVIDEEQNSIDTLTLKSLSVETNTILSKELSTYIAEVLTPEIINLITLDITKVNTNIAGTYQYTVTYNNRMYTGTIDVYEPNLPVQPEVEVSPVIPDVEPEIPTTPETDTTITP